MAPVGQILANYWRKDSSANAAIVLFCLALIGIVWAVTFERVSFERDDTIAAAAKQNANLAIAFEEHTIRTLKSVDQAVLFVKDQYEEHGLKLNIGRMIENGALDASLFNFIGITDERGNVVLGRHEFKPTNVADRESFKVHLQHNDNEMFIGKLNLGRITHRWNIPVSHRINKADGSFGGIVYASMDPEYFTGFYEKADLGEHGAISLMGLDGIARATQIGRKGTFGEDMRGTRVFEEQAKNRIGSFLGGGRLDGVVRFLSFRTLEQYPLIVTVGTSEADIMAPFHERERRYYLTAGFASTMIVIIAAFIMAALSRRKRALEVLEQSMQRVQALSERVMKIQREERERIARELHDELGQTLTALKVNLQMLEPYCVGGEAEDHLTEALMITGRSLDQVRGMMLDLRPLGLEDLGLAVVLESHLAKQAEAAGWHAQFEATLPGRLHPELEMACFRVAQEALTNVMRHSHAKQVRVTLGMDAGEVQLSVRDDGTGFDVAAIFDASRTGGFGLIGMQERVRQLGGRLAIHSAPGRGTEVRASFPCEPAGGWEPDANASTHA